MWPFRQTEQTRTVIAAMKEATAETKAFAEELRKKRDAEIAAAILKLTPQKEG